MSARRTRTAVVAVTLLAAFPAAAVTAAPAAAGILPSLDSSEQIGPGMTYRHVQYPQASGWVDAYLLTADLAQSGVRIDLGHPPVVAQGMALSRQLANVGAIAGVNADFFDINNSYASIGFEVAAGALRKTAAPEALNRDASIVTSAGRALISQLRFSGTVRAGGSTLAQLSGVNSHSAASGGIVAFTPLWGTYSRARATNGAGDTAEVLVQNGVVTAVSSGTPGSGAIPSDGFYLVGREGGATTLDTLQVGDPVTLDYAVASAAGDDVRFAVSGGARLVRDGVLQSPAGSEAGDPLNPNPRTGIGFDRDGRRVYLAVVDGRRSGFPGVLQSELGRLLLDAGAWNAQNLDGGGSSELIARPAGSSSLAIRNVPSDGQERTDANSVGLFIAPGDGTARTLLLDPDGDAARSSGAPARVFAGLQRRFRVATAVDAGWGPATLPATPAWSASGGRIATDGRLRAPAGSGRLTVTATASAASGSTAVTVLDAPRTLEPSSRSVAFGTASSSPANVTLSGRDADGFTAPLDAADTTFTYDRAVVTVTAASDGRLRITPRAAGATVVAVSVGDAKAELAVTVGSARAPAIDAAPVADRLVAAAGGAPAAWSFAALAAPDIAADSGERADATVAALARIRATAPDFVLVSGVTESGGDGQALAARDVLRRGGCQLVTAAIDPPTASAGSVSCVVLPGDGDRQGGTLSSTFNASFGPAWRVFDHKRTRFVLLDSSAGTLLGDAVAQLDALDAALDGAVSASGVDNVVVATHRPAADPLGDGSRQLADPRETALLEKALAGFAQRSDKPVVLLSGGGRNAAVRHADGVAELGLPALGSPRGSAATGGFTGWTRLAVDAGAPDGVVADVRPSGSAVVLDAAAEVAVDATIPLAASLTQGDRTVPLAYPVSPRWDGSAELAIGSGGTALAAARAAGKVALLDPVTRQLTGLRAGTVTIAVETDAASGTQPLKAARSVTVTAATTPPDGPPLVGDPGPQPGLPTPPAPLPGGGAGTKPPVRTAAPAASILSLKATRAGFAIVLRAPAAGRLTVSATATPRGGTRALKLSTSSARVRKAGRVTVTLRASRRTRALLAAGRGGRATVKAQIRFVTADGRSRTTTKSVVVRVKR
ncbi:phosphodiester glycosidase family protein [Conexibacter sp. JD483]|uniref:phosphodiester glycosidase family protein n=1 Tax=unclassified Conexibacter TaxID=2627773 RepID=UPI0027189BC7|nr:MULTISPECIES: phosphodiester glycosidase family protein [unclassified Conexibacter]MDO8187269.1 phosphodiester glycosidase family protein [Conexibacter sp. CPCC 205706]MDO8198878.1 phosphodiester glycosidase family protein [Conexibacter sp. CPCC 205762]MDR9371852.1 phosphodiester glycosidase family protein [Conexibacter sp. JD483]